MGYVITESVKGQDPRRGHRDDNAAATRREPDNGEENTIVRSQKMQLPSDVRKDGAPVQNENDQEKKIWHISIQ
jgi:hypothetical protein